MKAIASFSNVEEKNVSSLAKSNGTVEAFLLLDTYISSFEKCDDKNKKYLYSAKNLKEYFFVDGHRFLNYVKRFLWVYKITSVFCVFSFYNFFASLINKLQYGTIDGEKLFISVLFMVPILLFTFIESDIKKGKIGFSSVEKFNQYNNFRKKDFLSKFNISSSHNDYRKSEQQQRILDLFHWGKLAFASENLFSVNDMSFERIFNKFIVLNIKDSDYSIEVESLLYKFMKNLDNVSSENGLSRLSAPLRELVCSIRGQTPDSVSTIEDRVNSILSGNEQRLMEAVSRRVRK